MSDRLKYFVQDYDEETDSWYMTGGMWPRETLAAAKNLFRSSTKHRVINGRGEVVWPEPQPEEPDLWWEYLRGNGQWALSSHSNEMSADEMEEHLKLYRENNNSHCAYRLIDHATGEVVHEIPEWRKPQQPKYRLEHWYHKAGYMKSANPLWNADEIEPLYNRGINYGGPTERHGRIVEQATGKVVKEWRTRPLREWLEEGVVPKGYEWSKAKYWGLDGIGVAYVLRDNAGELVSVIDRDVTVVTVESEEE